MILLLVTARRTATVALTTPAGQVVRRRDASWRVGSGQSLATHVSELLAEAECHGTDLTRLALVDQEGSFTSARTAYAFTQALGFAANLPILLIRETDRVSIGALARRAAGSQPVTGPIAPSYSASRV